STSFGINGVNQARVPKEASAIVANNTSIVLEDYNLDAKEADLALDWANLIAKNLFEDDQEQRAFVSRFVIVSDTLMSFLATYATDVVTRTAIEDESGVGKGGQLWTEENLPAESILCSVIHHVRVNATESDSTVWAELSAVLGPKAVEQFGGNATVGRGQ